MRRKSELGLFLSFVYDIISWIIIIIITSFFAVFVVIPYSCFD